MNEIRSKNKIYHNVAVKYKENFHSPSFCSLPIHVFKTFDEKWGGEEVEPDYKIV